MRKIPVLILLAGALSLTPIWPVTAEQDCAELLEENCTSCHYNTRICNKIGKKNKRKWQVTVKRMRRYGLKLDKATQNETIACLVSLEKESVRFCKD